MAHTRPSGDDVGLNGAQFVTTVVTTTEDAHRLGFIGSPTILVDGQDPFTKLGAQPALACGSIQAPPARPASHRCETSDRR